MPPNFEPKQPNFQPQTPQPPERPNIPPPIPSHLKQDHSMPMGEQHMADPNNLPKTAGQNLFQGDVKPADPNYDFIFNHAQVKQPKAPIKLPGSLFGKIGVIVGGIIVVIIIFAVGNSLLKGSSNLPSLVAVLQDQQELIHISNNAAMEPDISTTNQNFAATASLALGSSSTALESYITSNGSKVNPTSLTLKESTLTDKTLTNAEASGDFNSTFTQISTQQLIVYINDLKTAYNQAKGPKGQALLLSDFKQAKILANSLSGS